MKKLGFIARFLQKALSSIIFPRDFSLSYFLPRTSFDYQREVGEGTQSSVVMAPVFWICRRFAEAKYIIKKDDEIQKSHDVLSLLEKPNQFYSGRLLRMAAALSYNLDGNVYFLKIRNKQLKPIELWYIPHWMIEPHFPESSTKYIDYYNYSPQGINIPVDPSDVIHVRFGIDPYNTRKGMSPLKSLFREIFTDDEAANFSASLLRNMGIPGLIISPGSDNVAATPADVEAIKKKFKEKFGRDCRGEPLIMTTKTDVKQFGFSPGDMDLSKLREIPEERVTAILGVPAAVVGFGTGLQQTKVGATMKELREAAYEDCIIPMQNLFADEINTQLLPDFEENLDQWKIDFDLSKIRVLQEDENAKAERMRGLVKDAVVTQGEARRELGFEVKPEHNVYLMPFNITAIPAGDLTGMSEQPAPQNAGKSFILPILFNPEKKSVGWKRRLISEFEKSHARLSNIFSRELRKTFDSLGDQAAEAWERIVRTRGVESLSFSGVEKKDQIDDLYVELLMGELDTDVLDYSPHYLRTAIETFETIKTITGLGVNLTDENEARIMALGGTRKGLVDIDQQTKDVIFKALKEARDAGEGAYQAALRIRDMVAAGPWSNSSIRSKVIARTETKYCQNQSSLEAYRSGGITQVEIVDGQLPASDEECINRNGRIIPIDEAENLEEHPNGTLSWTPVIGEFQG